MRGCDGDRKHARPRPSGRRAGLPRAHRPLPGRAAGALLPDPRLGGRRGGHAARDPPGCLARPEELRGPVLAAHLVAQDRGQRLPERAARPQPPPAGGATDGRAPQPTRLTDPVWVEPYPDVLLDGLPDLAPGPEARYDTKESIELAFITALQHLPPRQRAVLVLRDVLGYRTAEVADMLDGTEASVKGVLQRARAELRAR